MSEGSIRGSVAQRLWAGARAGARLGLYFGLLAAFTAANPRHPQRVSPKPPLPSFLAVWIGCVAGGIIVAFGRPLVRDRYGAALLGAGAVAPLLIALAVALIGMPALSAGGILGMGAASLILGGAFGVSQWSPRGCLDGS